MKRLEVRADSAADGAPRVLHLTDTHLFADADSELRGVNTHLSLAAVCRHFITSKHDADVVLVTGDLVQDDSRAAYLRCRETLEALELPVQLCPGNHDVRKLMRDVLERPGYDYCSAVRIGAWSVISIDSCVDGQPGGRVSDAELERLASLLTTCADSHVLLCLHHPPVELGSRWLDSVGLENGDKLLELTTRAGNVRAMLFGHAHQAFDEMVNNIRLLCTPSTCRQFKPGSDVFAVDDEPPAYRMLELHDDGTIETSIQQVNYG